MLAVNFAKNPSSTTPGAIQTDINNRELTQLRDRPATGGLVPHHLPPVHTGQLPQTIHTQLVNGGPPRTSRDDPPLVDPQ